MVSNVSLTLHYANIIRTFIYLYFYLHTFLMQNSFYVHDVFIIIVYDYDKSCMFIFTNIWNLIQKIPLSWRGKCCICTYYLLLGGKFVAQD